ncbi:hypothetical protein [Rhizomonospora bruguierae]|uniref:hypothetical protein n=1 Tax=Rhizomonospora bruguierae TaxID=1581705 RepID=UPI001BCD2C92|nr:hypothetical protein [Micromonospora sp. NBRC 107566]
MALRPAARLLAVVASAAVALAGLTACRSDPQVAAYVGDRVYSVAEVQRIYDQAGRALAEALQASGRTDEVPLSITRVHVVQTLVGRDVLRAVAQERQLSPVEVPVEQAAQALNLPSQAEFAAVYAEYQGYLQAVETRVEPKASDADLRDVYDRLRAAGLEEAQQPFAQWSATLSEQNREMVGRTVATRDLLRPEIEKQRVAINPRYSPTEITLLSFDSKPLVVVPLRAGATGDPVTDLGEPAA